MEYTSLLAGESFSDAPLCVDRELAAVMRHANDKLSDADRQRLLPLLGRSVGLVVPRPPVPGWQTLDAEVYDRAVVPYARTLVALHRRVSERFMAAIGFVPTAEELRRCDEGREVDFLFWRLMQQPTRVRGKAAYVSRLLDRLELLHECYELAMRDLDLPGHPARRQEIVPAERPTVPAPRSPDPDTLRHHA